MLSCQSTDAVIYFGKWPLWHSIVVGEFISTDFSTLKCDICKQSVAAVNGHIYVVKSLDLTLYTVVHLS